MLCFASAQANLTPCHVPDVRGPGAAEYGRERPADHVRGVRPRAPDQRAAGQGHRRKQRLVLILLPIDAVLHQ